MEEKIQGSTYPTDFYVSQDRDGNVHWYKEDPMGRMDRKEVEVRIGDIVMDVTGGSTVANPARVRLFIGHTERCMKFAVSQPNDIRTGKLDRHFEDQAGHVVEILQHPSDDVRYPLQGVLFDKNGKFCGNAAYSLTGLCSDGLEDHNLWCVKGGMMPKMDNNG